MPEPPLPEEGDPIDPGLQRAMLRAMRAVYPQRLRRVPDFLAGKWDAAIVNLTYLEQHGLCISGLKVALDGTYQWNGPMLTHRGVDYLRRDGGLTAELNVLTVKVHADSVRELIEARIDASTVSPGERERAKGILRGLSDTAPQAGVSQVIRLGIDHLPNVVAWLRTLAAP